METSHKTVDMHRVMRTIAGINTVTAILFLLCALVAGTPSTKDKLALIACGAGTAAIGIAVALIAVSED